MAICSTFDDGIIKRRGIVMRAKLSVFAAAMLVPGLRGRSTNAWALMAG